jgi:hypothetical protein
MTNLINYHSKLLTQMQILNKAIQGLIRIKQVGDNKQISRLEAT